MTNNASGAGMGTAGLVGQLMTWQDMSGTENGVELIIKIILLHFIFTWSDSLDYKLFNEKKRSNKRRRYEA